MLKVKLDGKCALVTGGASGIGLACVTMLAESGAAVAVNHLPQDEAGIARIAKLRDRGLNVIAAPGNVAIPGEAEHMVETAITALGGLDYLVNNAGTPGTANPIPPDNLDALTEGLWDIILNTNLIGPFRCARAAAPALRQRCGAIVNLASIAGLGRQGSSSAYSASKAGVVSLTRSLARGLAPEVRVNAVAPGQTRTPWTEGWPEERKAWARSIAALNRISEPEEIAEAVLFLCAGAAAMTGQVLVVDSGMTL